MDSNLLVQPIAAALPKVASTGLAYRERAQYQDLEQLQQRALASMSTPYLWNSEELNARRLIHPLMRQVELLRVFRELRTRLYQKRATRQVVVMVASIAESGRAAALTALNLAAAFAMDPAHSALYIDCNPYDSVTDDYVVVPVVNGMTDYLADSGIPVQSIIYPSGLPRLRIVPSGHSPDSAAEHFGSRKMAAFMEEIIHRYPDRCVVLEAPPLGSALEARVLAQFCDLTLLVAPYGDTTPEQVDNAVSAIDGPVAGMVYSYL